MIISPPFLPPREPTDTDEAYVRSAMSGGSAGDGGFPVSFELAWHGGMHLAAPAGAAAPVRAIADGVVAFVRNATAAKLGDPKHPLNYRGGWTDDGCVVLRHKTAIGTGDEITYFSIYMHLQSVAAGVTAGSTIYRKSPLGAAGRIYGQANKIHHEIVCDDANVVRLAGRSETFTTVRAAGGAVHHGRTDAVFGAMWFFLFTDTQFFDREPGSPGAAPARVIHQNIEAYPVRIELVQGASHVQTHHLDGRPLGAAIVEDDYEYKLLQLARTRYPTCVAAGYELLRFGRVIGTDDALTPQNAPNWCRVRFEGGVGWVDLNAATVAKLSDADMPHWDKGWMLIDASSSADSRCTDVKILELLDADKNWKVPRAEAQAQLNDPDTQERLSRKIVKVRSEWDGADLDARYGWLKKDPETKMAEADFTRFKAHVAALAFWKDDLGFPATCWHVHPRTFVRHFRKCGWLTLDELTQLLPRKPGGGATISYAKAKDRFRDRVGSFNRVCRKYNLLDATRHIHFLAQTYIETDKWNTMREYGKALPKADGTFPVATMEFYAAFYGRGIMQLTWAFNYQAYGTYRRFPNVAAGVTYGDTRITETSVHDWGPVPASGVHDRRRWFPRFDPEIVADDGYAACDSGAFYWVSKEHGPVPHRMSINVVCDRGVTTTTVGRVSVLVNGGGFGYSERQAFAAYLVRYRGDDTATTPTEVVTFTKDGTSHNVTVDYQAQRP